MPMHMVVGPDGHILRAARTLQKLFPRRDLVGENLFRLFEIRRPRGARSVFDLLQAEGGRLSLTLSQANASQRNLKAVIVSLGEREGALLNLSFGFSLVDAVRFYDLTAADFAVTDLAVEMLYLVEAKSAALNESKKLNLRLQGAKIAAEEQAFTDTLTGLKNRRALDHVLARLVRDRIAFGLLHLDIDYFKQVNDTHGHAAGDEVLQIVARCLVRETRRNDIVARVGGDEFTVVFLGLVDTSLLMEISSRIIRRLEEPIQRGGDRLRISGSIGVTTSERAPYRSIEALLAAADDALYASKRAGRGCATLAPAQPDGGAKTDSVTP
ncbi:diguanylate cyclase [Tropicimonas sp. IMCC6043]|nr:diguanylate cyclase [Tropicimonas sp. IMCC6043]